MPIEAADAAKALDVVANKLLEYEIVQSEGFAVMQRVANEIKLRKRSLSWRFEVDRGEPIMFSKAEDKNGDPVHPRIVAAGIHIEQGQQLTPPFKSLDAAIEVLSEGGKPIARWHLDLANEVDGRPQSGPLVHLQYGGHNHDARQLDHLLKVPRWCHPPMEIALLSEVVAANFFEEAWLNLRDEPSWCQSISVYEQLCYSHYCEKMRVGLGVNSYTLLNSMWASSWV
jgi:hypothetical protein